MRIFTDNVLFAESMIAPLQEWKAADGSDQKASVSTLIERLFSERIVYQNVADAGANWTHAFIVRKAPASQFDVLVDLSNTQPDMPGGIICLAGTGHGFHGQRKRRWASLEGNLHLAVHLVPERKIARFGVGFPILAAVSLVESIDTIAGLAGKASIKWVNDVLCDGAKIAGFLVHTSSMDETVSSVVLGFGLNIEKTPEIQSDPYVPKVGSIRDYIGEKAVLDQRHILSTLLDRLSANYEVLLKGQWRQLLEAYRKRSVVVGRRVRILSDPEDDIQEELGSGKVLAIGDSLELWLDGIEEPVKKGRLILTD